jgi:hypothetical protein
LNQEKKTHRNDLMVLKKSFREQIRKNRNNFSRGIGNRRYELGYNQYPHGMNSYLGQTGITNIAENQIINPQPDFLRENTSKNYNSGESIHH